MLILALFSLPKLLYDCLHLQSVYMDYQAGTTRYAVYIDFSSYGQSRYCHSVLIKTGQTLKMYSLIIAADERLNTQQACVKQGLAIL